MAQVVQQSRTTVSAWVRQIAWDRQLQQAAGIKDPIPYDKPGGRIDGEQICVRLTEPEIESLSESAALDGLELSPWLRGLVMARLREASDG